MFYETSWEREETKLQESILYKIDASNDFTITFALEELSEFAHNYGFDKAFEIAKCVADKQKQIKTIKVLYTFSLNHSTKWEHDYDSIIQFFLGESK
jgi:hypothetical protein